MRQHRHGWESSLSIVLGSEIFNLSLGSIFALLSLALELLLGASEVGGTKVNCSWSSWASQLREEFEDIAVVTLADQA